MNNIMLCELCMCLEMMPEIKNTKQTPAARYESCCGGGVHREQLEGAVVKVWASGAGGQSSNHGCVTPAI